MFDYRRNYIETYIYLVLTHSNRGCNEITIHFITAFFDSCRYSVKIKDIWYTREEYTSRDKKGILYERRYTNFIHQNEFVR